MGKKMNSLDLNVELFFPLELMFEILSWLPVKSLLRFKYVCKRWNEIIGHPKFIEMHMIRSAELIDRYCTSKSSAAQTFDVVSSSHGLLVEKSIIFRRYRVRNPATKHILAIPDPKEELVFMTIVFLASTSSFKLVYTYENERRIGFKVLSFEGSDLSWRTVDNSYFCEYDKKRQKACLDFLGQFYFFVVLYEDGSRDSEILCLDVETEILRGSPITVPPSFFCNWEKVELGRWDEKFIAVMKIVEDDLHVWLLEDPIKGKWAERKIIIPLTFLKENPDMKERLLPYWASDEEICFTMDVYDFVTYYTRSQQAWKSVPPENTIMCNGRFTLVTLKGMQAQKKQNSDDELEEIQETLIKLGN